MHQVSGIKTSASHLVRREAISVGSWNRPKCCIARSESPRQRVLSISWVASWILTVGCYFLSTNRTKIVFVVWT